MLLKVTLPQKLLLAILALVILPVLVQNNVVLQVGFLEERSLTDLALELLLAGVLLHVARHVLCGDRLAADVALRALLALPRTDRP